MKDLFDMNTNPANTLSLEQRVAMLNTDQRCVFDKVKAHFLHQKEHEANNTTPNVCKWCWWTGKLFLIKTIKSLVGHLWPSDDLTCAVAAPTGLAAFNVSGITIHRLFQLPVKHERCFDKNVSWCTKQTHLPRLCLFCFAKNASWLWFFR